MTSFNFPFSTCETCKSSGHPVQPWSTLVNAISTIILIVAATLARQVPIKIALSSFALFEAWHTFSHFTHLNNINHTNVVHVLSYGMSFASLYAILTLSKSNMTAWNIWVLIVLIGIDVYAWLIIKGILPIFTSLGIFAFIISSQYAKLPSRFKSCLPYMLGGVVLLLGLLVNEIVNCERMMDSYKFPYHVLVEIVGLALFVALAILFLDWDRMECN